MNPNQANANSHTSEAVPAHWAEAAVARALSQAPPVVVPVDFAARVTRHILAQPSVAPARWLGWGPRLALASGALLTAVMFAVAPHASPSLNNFAFDAELVAFAELGALVLFSQRLLPHD